MSSSLASANTAALAPPRPYPVATSSLTVCALTSEHQQEVLAYLAARSIHNVVMISLIRDNGLVSLLNRGTFYACRNRKGRLEGVALIGYATLLDARIESALAAFARFARSCPLIHAITGEEDKIKLFWSYYAGMRRAPRLICHESLFEQRWPVGVHQATPVLRPATLDNLSQIMPAHAEMADEVSGVDPLKVDPLGFRMRCVRRIEQGRVWVLVEDERLIFKADVTADTPETIYLEGVYVNREERGKGHGLRCLSQLSRNLLTRTRCVCLLVDEQNEAALGLYRKAGFKMCSRYNTIFP